MGEFYDLSKTKFIVEFDQEVSGGHQDIKVARSQFIHYFELAREEKMAKVIEQGIGDGCKRLYLDLGVHIKQFFVSNLTLLVQKDDESEWKKIEVDIPYESEDYGTMPSMGTPNITHSQSAFETISSSLDCQHLKSWYLTPRSQAMLFGRSFGGRST